MTSTIDVILYCWKRHPLKLPLLIPLMAILLGLVLVVFVGKVITFSACKVIEWTI